MSGPARPWGAGEQADLVAALRAGHPPVQVCERLGRTPDEVRRRLALLLGDVVTPPVADPASALDVAWLRLHVESVAPTAPTGEDVVEAWQHFSGVGLTAVQEARLAADPLVPVLVASGRHALLVAAARLVESTGGLVLEDWVEAVAAVDVDGLLPLPDDPTVPDATAAVRQVVNAAVEDIADPRTRRALARHLGLVPAVRGVQEDARARGRALVEVSRAGGLGGRPAARLRDALREPASMSALLHALPVEPHLTVATTLGVLAGHNPLQAQRLAGRLLTPWHRPPNLGRGVVVRPPR